MIDRIRSHEMTGQFARYATIGVLNVGLYLGILNVLLAAGLPKLAANAIGFFLTSINSFFLNRNWAFRDPRRHAVLRHYGVFLFFTMIGLGINTVAFSSFLALLHHYGHQGRLGANVAALASVPFSVIWNFVSYRRWTFATPATG